VLVGQELRIHGQGRHPPDHVPCINDVFSVSPEAADKYRASIDTYYASGEGFVIRDGEVIAPPFIAKAKKMLRFYEKS